MGDGYRLMAKRQRSPLSPERATKRLPRLEPLQKNQWNQDLDSPVERNGSLPSSRRSSISKVHRSNDSSPKPGDEPFNRLVRDLRKVSAASVRHDQAQQRADSAQKDYILAQPNFAAFPSLAEQNRNRKRVANDNLSKAESDLSQSSINLERSLRRVLKASQPGVAISVETQAAELESTKRRADDANRNLGELEKQSEAQQDLFSQKLRILEEKFQQDLHSLNNNFQARLQRQSAEVETLMKDDRQRQAAEAERRKTELSSEQAKIRTLTEASLAQEKLNDGLEAKFKMLTERIDQSLTNLKSLSIQHDVLKMDLDTLKSAVDLQSDLSKAPADHVSRQELGPIITSLRKLNDIVSSHSDSVNNMSISKALEPVLQRLSNLESGMTPLGRQGIDELRDRLATVEQSAQEKEDVVNQVIEEHQMEVETKCKETDEKLNALSSEVYDLDRRFNCINTDGLLQNMVHQMRTLYPAPANLQAAHDSVLRMFADFKSQVHHQLRNLNSTIETAKAAKAVADTIRDETSDSRKQNMERFVKLNNGLTTLQSQIEKVQSQAGAQAPRAQDYDLESLKISVSSMGGRIENMQTELAQKYREQEDEIGLVQAEMDGFARHLGIDPVNWSQKM